MSTSTRRRVARAVAVAAIAACATGGCTTALRSDTGVAQPATTTQAQPTPDTTANATSSAAARPGSGLAELDGVQPVPLGAPEFGREPPAVAGTGGLSVVTQSPNDIVDTAAWFRAHQLEEPSLAPEQAPADVPRSYRGMPLASVLRPPDTGPPDTGPPDTGTPDTEFLLYGPEFEPTVLVAVAADTREVGYALDLGSFAQAPEVAPNEQEFVTQAIRWAQQVGPVLYVSTGHRTYATSSAGMNAYLTAIDVETRTVLWRSTPLVANADTFTVVDDRIVTGYGFTAEPDWLYVLDRATGVLSGGLRLASGPEFIVARGDQLLVRCYDTDYVVALGP